MSELTGGADPAGAVLACVARSLAAASAKVKWREDWDFASLAPVGRRRRSGGVLAPVLHVGGRLVKATWKRAMHRLQAGHLVGEGVLEPASGRYMIGSDSFAQLYDGKQVFTGRPGRALATLEPFPPVIRRADVLWTLRVLSGITDAEVDGEDVLRGTTCTRMSVHIDLAKASGASAEGLRSPAVDRFEQLLALPATVWIDGEYVRRVAIQGVESRDVSLELWDYGVATDDLDWARLPTFESPEEQAAVAGRR